MSTTRAIGAFAGLALSFTVQADLLYSIDADTDELVTIDPVTGAVTVVGPLGQAVGDVDLTMHDGELYGLNSFFEVRVDLLVIDRDTGAASAPMQVTDAGVGILHAEALASVCGDLVIGFRDSRTAVNAALSNALATVAADGSVRDVVPFGSSADFDALSADATGSEIRSIDVQAPTVPSPLYVGDRKPPQLTAVNAIALGEFVNDILLHRASVYLISHTSPTLYRTDPVTGVLLAVVPLDRPGNYKGLAADDPGTCAGDVDRGGGIGFQDLTQLLGNWGPCASCPCPWDFDGDGSVGFNDLTTQLGGWGACPEE